MKTLKDKVIVITGAGGNIAGAVEESFRNQGARVILVDKAMVRIQGRASTYGTMALEADFSSLESAQETIRQIKQEAGRIDGLVHLVGDIVNGKVVDVSAEDFHTAFNTNIQTLFYAVKAVLPELLGKDEAFIAGIASQEISGGGQAGSSLFAAAKSAVAAFLRSLDAELASTRVNVSIIFPMGLVDTLFNRQNASVDTDSLIKPKAIAQAFVTAALSGEGGSFREIAVYPPRLSS